MAAADDFRAVQPDAIMRNAVALARILETLSRMLGRHTVHARSRYARQRVDAPHLMDFAAALRTLAPASSASAADLRQILSGLELAEHAAQTLRSSTREAELIDILLSDLRVKHAELRAAWGPFLNVDPADQAPHEGSEALQRARP
jgi:hypothetical protein